MLYSGNCRFVDIIYVYLSIHSKRGYIKGLHFLEMGVASIETSVTQNKQTHVNVSACSTILIANNNVSGTEWLFVRESYNRSQWEPVIS